MPPAASYRERVVPEPPEEESECAVVESGAVGAGSGAGVVAERPPAKRRYSWAELMKRVHRVDVLICESRLSRNRLRFCSGGSCTRA